jgi:glc operon protein GlcG
MRRPMTTSATLLVILVCSSMPLMATPATLTAQTALQIINGCSERAKAKNQSHAIAVYDDGGNLLAFLRMDGNAPGIGEFAMQKGQAVAHWHFSTAQMASSARETPGFADAPNVVTVAGGIPVYSADGGQFIGAVGVSGEAPQDDAACAEAGVKAAGLAVARKAST